MPLHGEAPALLLSLVLPGHVTAQVGVQEGEAKALKGSFLLLKATPEWDSLAML